MNKKLKAIIKEISKQGGRVFYVGGYVRDKFIGKDSKDIDLEIHGISVEDTKKVLSKFGKVDEVGASFGILMIKGLDVDFSFPRKERNTGPLHTDFDVMVDPFMSFEDACRRRDFTMNAIMEDVLTGEVIDPFNGVQAIKDKTIQYVDKSTFVEDALRPLRACQFAARFEFEIHEDVINCSKEMDFSHLTKERISVEVEKALMSQKPSVAFNYMREMGITENMFPSLHALIGVEQRKENHPEGDVWNHTMLVLNAGAKLKDMTKDPRAFMYACLLHDIAKPMTTEVTHRGYIQAIDHDKVGAEMIPDVMLEFTKNRQFVPYVKMITKYHMRVKLINDMKDSKVRKLMSESGNIYDLLVFTAADVKEEMATKEDYLNAVNFEENTKKVRELSMGKEYQIVPYVKGDFLIQNGYKPSKLFKDTLEHALKVQWNGSSIEQVRIHALGYIRSHSK